MLSSALEILLNNFEDLKDFEFIEKVKLGYSNCVYKVGISGQIYKLRIADNNDIISRKNELKIINLLSLKELIYYDEDTGNSLSNWIPGENISRSEIDELFLDKLVNLIEDIHSYYSPEIINHDDLEFFDCTSSFIDASYMNLYKKLIVKYKDDNRVFCHNDISLSNLIYDAQTKTLNLIDYEWGRINNPYWDYGNFVKETDLNSDLINYLSKKANLDFQKFCDFIFISTLYSIQLSYIFKNQTPGLDDYRKRLFKQMKKYVLNVSGN